MEAVEKQPDQLNMFALVVITVVGAAFIYGSFVALQAYFEYSLTSLQDERRASNLLESEEAVVGVDFTLADLENEHNEVLSSYKWVSEGDKLVTLPIDVAMAKVVETANGAAVATMVPAIGPHDTPTVPAVAGRPPDNVQMPPPAPTPTESAEGSEGVGDDAGGAAAAGGAEAVEGTASDTEAATDAAGAAATGTEAGAAGIEAADGQANPVPATPAASSAQENAPE